MTGCDPRASRSSCAPFEAKALCTVSQPTSYFRMSARVDLPVLASRRGAAYRSTLDFGSTRAHSSCRAQPGARSKHRGVLKTQRHHSRVEQEVHAAEQQTFAKLTYKATQVVYEAGRRLTHDEILTAVAYLQAVWEGDADTVAVLSNRDNSERGILDRVLDLADRVGQLDLLARLSIHDCLDDEQRGTAVCEQWRTAFGERRLSRRLRRSAGGAVDRRASGHDRASSARSRACAARCPPDAL